MSPSDNRGDELLVERIRAAVRRREELSVRMADPAVLDDPARLRELAREHSELEPVVEGGRRYLRLLDELEQAREVA
ncbi:MAG: PCRF domain-containing protein, partial [Gemmatimonadota bacterium]|nr:PCRF domain-containing protein [Gemmatimonadota bacterium]